MPERVLPQEVAAVTAELRAVYRNLDAVLESLMVDAVRELSLRYPLRTVTACCAMGCLTLEASGKGWRVGREGGEHALSHPVLDTFTEIWKDWDFGALPVFLMEGRAGAVRLVRDWGAKVADADWIEAPPARSAPTGTSSTDAGGEG